MIKLYRKTVERTEYWEFWTTETEIVIHWGNVGEKGETRELDLKKELQAKGLVNDEMQKKIAEGFSEIDVDDMAQVVVQYTIVGRGTAKDLDKGQLVEDLMNECLGWTGLGNCDGNDIGSETLNIFCDVVDGASAEKVVIDSLKENGQLEGAIIARRQRGGDESYTVFWPAGFQGEFELM
jgi:predicted DNA-binding WGR domain protein